MWLKRIQIFVLAIIGSPILISCGDYNPQPGLIAFLAYDELHALLFPYRPGVTIAHTGSGGSVTEGVSTDSYTIVLNDGPSQNIVIQAIPDSQLLVNSSSAATNLTFTPTNWNTAQTLTVAAVDDTLIEGNHTGSISHVVSSGDVEYLALVLDDLVFDITDNDTAGVSITESGGSTNITEGGATDSYTIVLTSAPAADVVISISTDGQSTTDVPDVTFTSLNWSSAQTVTVTAFDDSNVEGAHTSTITHSASSVDPGYNGITISDVVANITDDDSAGVIITESGGSTNVEEGDSVTGDTYVISLGTTPAGSVDVDIAVAFDTAQVTVNNKSASPETVTLNSGNGWTATVTVKAVNDSACEQSHTSTITHSATSTDPVYNGITPISSVTVNIADVARVNYHQTGEVSMAGGATQNIPIAQSVTVSRSVLFCDFRTSVSEANSWPTCRLNSSSQIDIKTGAAVSTSVRYHLVEFETGVDVQRGSSSWTNLISSEDIAISSVDTGSSFVLVTARTTAADRKIDERVTVTGQLINATTLRLTRNESASAIEIEWQVVEIEAASVQSGTTQILDTLSSKVITAPANFTAVDPTRTFLFFNVRGDPATGGREIRYKVRGAITDGSTVTFNRQDITDTVDIVWYLVTLSDGATVQRGSQSFAGTGAFTQVDIGITSADTSRSVPIISASGGGGSDNELDTTSFTGYLTSSTNLRLNHNDDSLVSDADWQIVEFLAGSP